MSQGKEQFRRLSEFFAQQAARFSIILVYLFGSQARGEGGPISDYDFAILFSEKPPAPKRYALVHELARLLGTERVDLVVLNRANIELRYSVIATGCPLYEASRAARVEFEAQTLSLYFDYLPILRRQRRELLAEEEYGARIQRYRAALREAQELLAQTRAA